MLMDRRWGSWLAGWCLLLALNSCGSSERSSLDEAWERYDAPEILLSSLEKKFLNLPTSSHLDILPYADSYWPNERGGIAYRWKVEEIGEEIELYPLEDLVEFTREDFMELSPSEKYDILQAHYDYPLTQSELRRTVSSDPDWMGLCHGWAGAASNFSEPKSIVLKNPDGLRIPFGSADIKALLAYFQQKREIESKRRMLGLRCMEDLSQRPEQANQPPCKGVNPGSFHMVLANYIDRLKKPFIVDIDRELEVWNYVAYGFKSEVVSSKVPVYDSAALGTTQILHLKTSMLYHRDIEPQEQPLGDSDMGQKEAEKYEYYLELNSEGEIIGGEWISQDRVDFMWQQGPPKLEGKDWRVLQKLLRKSQAKRIFR